MRDTEGEEGYKPRDLKELYQPMFRPCTDPYLHNIR